MLLFVTYNFPIIALKITSIKNKNYKKALKTAARIECLAAVFNAFSLSTK